MKILVCVLVTAWALISIALGALAFAVVKGSGGSVARAAYEAVETIPEAVVQAIGFGGVPVLVVVAYWIGLTAALFFAFKRK